MSEREQLVKHLEMIQGVINRLGFNSFLLKGWSVTILAAALLFVANSGAPEWIACCFAIPVIGFWGLDGYFLWQERLFRKLYNSVRRSDKTDFSMAVDARGCGGWLRAACSRTLVVFYMMELVFLLVTFLVLLCADYV